MQAVAAGARVPLEGEGTHRGLRDEHNAVQGYRHIGNFTDMVDLARQANDSSEGFVSNRFGDDKRSDLITAPDFKCQIALAVAATAVTRAEPYYDYRL